MSGYAYVYYNIQEKWIIISMMLERHSREDTYASSFHSFAKKNFGKKFTIRITYICTQLYCNNNFVKII